MKGRVALGILLVVTLAVVIGPALVASAVCPDDEDADCCGLECAACLCCSIAPRTTLPFAAGAPGSSPAGDVGAEAAAIPPGPLPYDVLHVPIASASC